MSDPWVRREVIGNATLYLGDCLEILPTLPKVDAVITDPPYGLGNRMQGGTWAARPEFADMRAWDQVADQEWIDRIIALNCPAIIWGGNSYEVPCSRCWLIWDKRNAVPTMADFEMAWTNLDMPSKRFHANVGRIENGHPTEKPIGLMIWCVEKTAGTVLDPFMGSGTTGVACMNLGRKFIGIEIEKRYFDIAVERITNAQRQPRLFDEPKLERPETALLPGM